MGTIFHLSSLLSDPLLSCVATLYILILLYFPRVFLTIAFSPILVLTGILLLTLLRIGASQKLQIEGREEEGGNNSYEAEKPDNSTQAREWVTCPTKNEMGFAPNPDFEETFVEWDVGAPLEVIYEANEGEEDDDPNESHVDKMDPTRRVGIERTSSLSMYYPETDSDNSSEGDYSAEWDSPERMCFRWEEEDRESLIEIALEDHNKRDFRIHDEEENMIEIDISPVRNDDAIDNAN